VPNKKKATGGRGRPLREPSRMSGKQLFQKTKKNQRRKMKVIVGADGNACVKKKENNGIGSKGFVPHERTW